MSGALSGSFSSPPGGTRAGRGPPVSARPLPGDGGPPSSPTSAEEGGGLVYGVIADRRFTSVALVVDPEGVALREAASPVMRRPMPAVVGPGEGCVPATNALEVFSSTLAAMSPTTAARTDVNSLAVESGVEFRFPHPCATAGGCAGVDNGLRAGVVHTAGDAPSTAEPSARGLSISHGEGSDAQLLGHLPLEGGRALGVGGPAGVDDLLYTLGLVTYQVLAHYFPDGARGGDRVRPDGKLSPGALLWSTGDDTPPAPDSRSGDDVASAAAPGATADLYALPFLDSAEARASSTLAASARGGGTASDDATADTPLCVLLALLGRLAGPVAVTQVLRTSMGLVTTAFMGHFLTTEQFAAAATGLSFTNLTALNIGNGFSAALDTLATREHGRRPHSPEIVAILMRGVICTFAVYVPIAVFYFYCEPLLALMIHADLVADTAYFLRMSVFIATPMILNNNMIKFAQAQRVTQLGVISSSVGILLLVPLLFVFRTQGIKGIIIALAINRFCVFGIVFVSMFRNPGLAQSWRGRTVAEHIAAVLFRPRAFLHFVKVGLPILAANCADSWAIEALGIIAAHLGPITSATWNIIMAIYLQVFALHIGIAAAAAIRIGNAIGAGKGLLGRRYVLATIVLSGSCTCFCVLALWLFAKPMFRILQSNEAVTLRGADVRWLAGCTFAADSMFYVMQGPFRGCGYNGVLLFIVATGMWGCTFPLAMVLGVVERYDVEGILFALFAGMSVAFPLQIAFLLFGVRWDKHESGTSEARAAALTDDRAPPPPPSSAIGAPASHKGGEGVVA